MILHRKPILLYIFLLLLLLPASLLADRIILRNGATITGQIINQNEGSVVIRTRQGIKTISKATIARIQYGNLPDPEEEQRKEQERKREEERKRQEELRRQETQRQKEEAEQQRIEEERKRREERQEAEDSKKPMPSDSTDSSWLPDLSFSRTLWDPDLGLHRVRAGLSVGTTNHDWLGIAPIRVFRQTDSLFANSQVFSQESLEVRNGWHSTADLEYGINRYFVSLQASVSRQEGEATFFRAGYQRPIFVNNVEIVFGSVTEPGIVENNRMRWEDTRFLFGYKILYGDGPALDFFAGFNRSVSMADVDYAGLASFEINPDRQYRTFSFRSYAKMNGWETGFRGTFDLPADWAPGDYKSYVPDLEWEAAYISMRGTQHYSYNPIGFSTLYGARGRAGVSALDYEGNGGRGVLGLKFGLPGNFSLHFGGYGSELLLKAKRVYNETDDSDVASSLRAQISPIFLLGIFTTKEVRRGTYLRVQWEKQF